MEKNETKVEAKSESKPAYTPWKPGEIANEPSKEVWDQADPTSRRWFERRMDELLTEHARIKPLLERAKTLEEHHQAAEARGETLQQVLERYVAIDESFRRNPLEGLARLAATLGISQ